MGLEQLFRCGNVATLCLKRKGLVKLGLISPRRRILLAGLGLHPHGNEI